jgi:threonine dehydratase
MAATEVTVVGRDDVARAAEGLRGRLHRTPTLSARSLGPGIRLKAELLQRTGSFKPRGVLTRLAALTPEERERGVIGISAGNHAQALAWGAASEGVDALVVMWQGASEAKIAATRAYGASVDLEATDPAGAFDRLGVLIGETGRSLVHPFDDPLVIAGQGTVALELLEQEPELDVVVVPIGGGGLMGGVTVAVKELRPSTRVYGVELEAGPGMKPALEAGVPVPAPRPAHTLADGMTPPFVGALPLEIAQQRLDGIVTVTERQIIDAMRWLMSRAKLVVEGSGAAATAALLAGRIPRVQGARVVSIVSGGNVDPERLDALADAQQEALA